jgi:hypothetical protein
MQSSLQTVEVSEGLDELLETQVRTLAETLCRPHTIEEIEVELGALNDLVYTYKRRDELLEKLLDTTTAEEKRGQILEALRAQRMQVARNRADLERLHLRSHELLQRSLGLVIKAQGEIDKKAHKHTGYSLEPCGLCNGIGGSIGAPCVACSGKGSVLVRQPALRCTRCGGDGKPHTRQVLLYSSTVCIVCRGTGWVMTADA